ncbi:MAG TPA: hypothetical protein VLE19_11650, partial [Pyrinomonadaceae bacterium]|nr:hypothetical protein [Pyrinomonadaceae bacterium]
MKSQRTTLSVITLSLTVLVTAAGFCLPSLFGNDQAIPPTARVTSPARPRPVGERRGKLAEALSVVPVNSDNIKLQLEVNGSIVGKLAAQVPDPFAALARTAFIPRTLTTFGGQDDRVLNQELAQRRVGENSERRTPKEQRLIKAHSFDGDLRDLPYRKPRKRERPEREEPRPNPRLLPGPGAAVS